MDVKKKGLIIAVVIALLLLIGAFFIFKNDDNEPNGDDANNNQSEVDKSQNDGDKDQDEDEDQDDEDDSKKPQNNAGNTVTNPDDTSYEDAKKAIETATGSLAKEDIDAAAALIEKVKDKTKKAELVAALESLKELKNVAELLENLQTLVDEAETKTDITNAGEYRDTNKIQDAITALSESDAKVLYQELLDTLSEIIDDEEKPVIEGIKNGEATNKDVSLKVSDLNSFTISVTRDDQPYGSDLSQTEDGTYVVTVVDKALNKSTITFTIDKTGPTFKGLENEKYYLDDVDVVVEDEDLENITKTVCNPDCVTEDLANNTTLSQELMYELTATDKLGNTTTIKIIVDKVDPVILIEGLAPTTVKFGTDKEVIVTDVNLKSVTINGEEQIITNGAFTATLSESNVYEIVATDMAGRESSVIVEIDKNGPTFTGLTNGLYYTDNITVDFEDTDVILVTKTVCTPLCGATEEINVGTVLSDEAVYELVAYDNVGNPTKIMVGIDKTMPSMTVGGVDSSEIASDSLFVESKTIRITDVNLKSVTINDIPQDTINGAFTTTLTETGTYTIVATDYANQSVTITFGIDVTGPRFSVNGVAVTELEFHSNTNASITIDDEEGTIQKEVICADSTATGPCYEDFASSTPITEGTVKLVATDKLGNKTYLTLVIDKSAPVIKVGDDSITANQVFTTAITPVITEDNISTILLNSVEYNGTEIDEEGIYTLEVTDKAGNSATVTFIVRLTALQIENPTYDTSTENVVKVSIEVNKEVKVVKLDSETGEMVEDESWTFVSDGTTHTLTKDYTENTPSTGELITIQDSTGATTDVTINVTTLGSGA